MYGQGELEGGCGQGESEGVGCMDRVSQRGGVYGQSESEGVGCKDSESEGWDVWPG